MTWIPCSRCHNAPCTCSATGWPATQTFTPTTVTGTSALFQFQWQRLHPDDIEAIAKRVMALMNAARFRVVP